MWDTTSATTFLSSSRKWVIWGKTKYHLELRLTGRFHYGTLVLWADLCQNLIMLSEVPHMK